MSVAYKRVVVRAGERWVITGTHLCAGYGARLGQSPRKHPAPEEESKIQTS